MDIATVNAVQLALLYQLQQDLDLEMKSLFMSAVEMRPGLRRAKVVIRRRIKELKSK